MLEEEHENDVFISQQRNTSRGAMSVVEDPKMDNGVPYLVTLAVILFGASSWLSVNSVWVEVPIMVNSLPESWNLPSFLSVVVQIACIGPILYGVSEKLLRNRLRPSYVIYGMLVLGCTTTMLLSVLWQETTVVGADRHSVALFVLLFFLSIVDCTSSVLFLPYMFSFKSHYVTIYFIGMGFSGLIPSALSLIQGSGKVNCNATLSMNGSTEFIAEGIEPTFNVATFNWIMFLFMTLALLAFGFLDLSSVARRERVDFIIKLPQKAAPLPTRERQLSLTLVGDETKPLSASQNKASSSNGNKAHKPSRFSGTNGNGSSLVEQQETASSNASTAESESLGEVFTTTRYVLLLVLTAWVCAFMNGILPSIQSFACLPYGQQAYHLTVALSSIANPAACFIPFFFELKSFPVMLMLTGIATSLCGFILFQAASSPFPLLVGHVGGTVVTIAVWILTTAMLSYMRTVLATVLRCSDKPRALFWCGAATQFGSFVGAILFFPLVNVFHLFKNAPACFGGL